MKLNTKANKFVAGAVLAVVTTLGATAAFAGRAYETEITYFDANGGYVGTKLYTCSGGYFSWGQTSSISNVVRTSCEGEF